MNYSDSQILTQKLTDLIEHGGYIITSKGNFYVQCMVATGEPGVDVEAVSHHYLESLTDCLESDFRTLGYKIDEELAAGNYIKQYTSSYAQQNISAIISDIQHIFYNIYKTDNSTEFQIEDHIDYPAVLEARKQEEKKWRRSSRNDFLLLGFIIALTAGAIYWYIYHKPGNPTNNTAVDLNELEAFQTEEQRELEKYAAKRDILSAIELIELSDCTELNCIQLRMKNKQPDFVHAKKGEFVSQSRGTIKDTIGNELIVPLSTFYVEVNAQATWKAAHTLHNKALADRLLNEFFALGFQFTDKRYYTDVKAEGSRYVSEKYPGKSLYVTATHNPWSYKDLYLGGASWPCWMFEVYDD